jgi:hypothetical protein
MKKLVDLMKNKLCEVCLIREFCFRRFHTEHCRSVFLYLSLSLSLSLSDERKIRIVKAPTSALYL